MRAGSEVRGACSWRGRLVLKMQERLSGCSQVQLLSPAGHCGRTVEPHLGVQLGQSTNQGKLGQLRSPQQGRVGLASPPLIYTQKKKCSISSSCPRRPTQGSNLGSGNSYKHVNKYEPIRSLVCSLNAKPWLAMTAPLVSTLTWPPREKEESSSLRFLNIFENTYASCHAMLGSMHEEC